MPRGAARKRQRTCRRGQKASTPQERQRGACKHPGLTRQRDRDRDQRQHGGDRQNMLPSPQRRQRAFQKAMDQIAGDDRQQRAEHEGRVRRTPEQSHAGQKLVQQVKQRRVFAERVEQRHHGRDREEADFARP